MMRNFITLTASCPAVVCVGHLAIAAGQKFGLGLGFVSTGLRSSLRRFAGSGLSAIGGGDLSDRRCDLSVGNGYFDEYPVDGGTPGQRSGGYGVCAFQQA
jgi:hypothetical protein